MSVFYLLPPRALLGQRLLAALSIPNGEMAAWTELGETLGKAVEFTGAYVVYRDDLPPDECRERALADGFGAEVGDEVIEICPDVGAGAFVARRWRMAA